MTNKKRILIISFSAIILCLCIFVGASYSLFTDSERVTTHLKSGELDITLERVNLEYTVLNDEGYLEIKEDQSVVDFTNSTDKNIFGLAQDNLMAPGAYYQATLKLDNKGTVAFDYTIEVVLTSELNEFADQLKVYVDGDTEGKTLSDINENNKYIITGVSPVEANTSKTFTVKVVFENLSTNNDAQDKSFSFDLVISATQTTEVKDNR